ncbi:MAG: exonuclease domain-containing protein, partial [archaeon]|nr:exonuclease domain-containing protein [archaeon]
PPGPAPPLFSVVGDDPYFPLSSAIPPEVLYELYHRPGPSTAAGKSARSSKPFSEFWSDPDLPSLEVGLLPNDRLLREISSSLKQADFVGYAPNTQQRPRNLVQRSPYSDPSQRQFFLYEEALPTLEEQQRSQSEPDLRMPDPVLRKRAPERYRFQLARHHHGAGANAALHAVAKSPARGTKKTNFTMLTALCNTLPNSYINPLLYSLYLIPSFRAFYLNHLCAKSNCLSCEAGFLFQLLDASGGGAIEASNMLRTFQRMSRAKQMGLIVQQNPPPLAKSPHSCFIERALRFFLQQLHLEHLTNTPHPMYAAQPPPAQDDIIEQLFGYHQDVEQTCHACSTTSASSPLMFWLDLEYPAYRHPVPSFATTLKRSLNRDFSHRRWCEQCSSYQEHSVHQSNKSLPNVICVNANLEQPEQLQFWKPAAKDAESRASWLPIKIRFVSAGSEMLVEECSDTASGPNVYEMISTVSHVADPTPSGDLSHYVALVNVRSGYFPASHQYGRHHSDAGWYLMNDGSLFPVSENEALSFDQPWKTPNILLYARSNLSQVVPPAPFVNPITDHVWQLPDPYADIRPAEYRAGPRSFQVPERLPEKGELIAIDIECVVNSHLIPLEEVHSTFQIGHFSLARVSVIHERDEDGMPILDDYIEAQEEVENYLTRYSGIEEGNLDPHVSEHHVLPLKYCYVKLRNLIDRGAIFVGHGLQQDLQIMNLYVCPSQIIDTVGLFRLKNQRNIKLAVLTRFLLASNIQEHTHCSIEDARSAMQVYRKYQQLLEENRLADVVHELYRVGRATNWTFNTTSSVVGLLPPSSLSSPSPSPSSLSSS